VSRQSNSSCIPITLNEILYLAQPINSNALPEKVELVRTHVTLEKQDQTHKINFDQLDKDTSNLAQQFLYSTIRTKLRKDWRLWQPSSGGAFYYKSPDPELRKHYRGIDVHRGFSARPIVLEGNKIGICIDVHSKYISRYPLPTDITSETINKYKGNRCLYEFGNQWYEITIRGLNDLNASKLEIPPDSQTLFDLVHERAGRHKSNLLTALPRDSSVIFYYTSDSQVRNVPSGLCRRIFRTDHPEISRNHRYTLKPPHLRRKQIQYVVNQFFRNLEFNGVKIQLIEPSLNDENKFDFPDLMFGNEKVLSTRRSGTTNVSPSEYPKQKKRMLNSEEAGIYTKKKFDKQFIIMPSSVLESFGLQVLNDIKDGVNSFYKNNSEIEYDPIPIAYDDSVQKSVVRLGNSIMKAIEENGIDYGFAVVMIPNIPSKRMGKEDELSNYVSSECRKRNLYTSIMHTKVSEDSFAFIPNSQGGEWKLIDDRRVTGKYRGYIQNVVLNKVLILNSIWPFVLKSSLNSDLIIGVDVKNNTAGFIVIHQTGEKLTFYESTSEQKEQLSKDHIRKKISEIIVSEKRMENRQFKDIVIHRQGTLFPSEEKGITEALKIMAKQGIIDSNYTCTFVEVRTTSRMPFRLFKIENRLGRQGDFVSNPDIGTYKLISSDEAFICTTGPPYRHKGTTNPLHIIKQGHLSIKDVIQDIYYLANLTWTKIDDCSRLPITVKFADIRLRESAGSYDSDAFRFE
ncbi:MAG: hypothetical protein ACTSWA_03615, partial [Candidatus Thorarchaeota archaeon]